MKGRKSVPVSLQFFDRQPQGRSPESCGEGGELPAIQPDSIFSHPGQLTEGNLPLRLDPVQIGPEDLGQAAQMVAHPGVVLPL